MTTPLDELPNDGARLLALYRSGERPDRLEGVFRGRLLPGWAPQPLFGLVPWKGKRLAGDEGFNRLRVAGERFPFEVRPGVSLLDGEPCLVLDYGRRRNPPGIRRLFDELRAVGPEVYLGPGFVRVRGRERLWTWFALTPGR